MSQTITLVVAPQVPTTEVAALKKHYIESILDPDYLLVVNYELRIDVIEKNLNDKLIVVAPGIPVTELKALKQMVDEALAGDKPEDRVVVVNYECLIFTMPQETGNGTYGEIVDPNPAETRTGHEEMEALIDNTYSELTGEKGAEEAGETDKEA
jgi:hypothetical protein